MRFATGILTFLVFVSAGLCQDTDRAPGNPVNVRSLTVVSGDLPAVDRQRIVRALQGGTYPQEELGERVRQSLRDLGYYNAQVETPHLAAIAETPLPRAADVTIQVESGAQYNCGDIHFQGASLFTPDQLRRQTPLEAGSLFNATAVGKGLEGLKNLYVEKGYLNFGAIPKQEVDETHHTVDLTIDIDEGQPYNFGKLILNGAEPRAGVGKSLLDAWKSIEGKRYNPDQLRAWLAAHTADWPGGALGLEQVESFQSQDAHVVSIRLQLP